MPVQPMSIQYNPIPDVEDVTPVDGPIKTSTTKTWKKYLKWALIIACCVVVGVLLWLGLNKTVLKKKSVNIYQTNVDLGDSLASIGTEGEMRQRGFSIGNIEFGNVGCSEYDQKKHRCNVPKFPTATISVDSSQSYQSVIGFGGAFTESAAHNFYLLPQAIQKKVIDLYFGENGIGYTLGRVHINSCDFSLKSYSFDDIEDDFSLQYFDTEVTHDNAQMLPLIRLATIASPKPLRMLASPWSPPAWMKEPTNGNITTMVGSATPNGLRNSSEVKQAWAKYISKFITAYTYKGVPIWAVTPQNEPEFPAPWEACAFTASFEKDFIEGYLGPTIKEDHPDTLILAFDHNKDHLEAWTEVMLGSGSDYIDGMAFHWYAGTGDRLMDGTYGYEAIAAAHDIAPDKVLLGSEGCSCPGVKLGDVLRAERLAHDVMFDLLNWAQGWIDWNLLVDSEGGPNHLGNMCDAPLVANVDFTDVVIQPKFYYFGHFSKFVDPGSVRVASSVVGSYGFVEIDPNVRAGMEMGVYPCEQSTRQTFKFTANSTIELATLAADSESTDGWKARLCIGPGDSNRPYLNVLLCTGSPLTFAFTDKGEIVDEVSGMCVTALGDTTTAIANGALLHLEPCSIEATGRASAKQTYRLDPITGEIYASASSAQCLTVGWPFLTAAAFQDTSQQRVVVVMNEAAVDTEIVLHDAQDGDLWFGINGRSIQTLVY